MQASRFILTSALAALCALPCAPARAQSAPQSHVPAAFPDVPRDHWAYEAVSKLAAAGIIEGYPIGSYRGNAPLSRNEFALATARVVSHWPMRWGPRPMLPPSSVSLRDTRMVKLQPWSLDFSRPSNAAFIHSGP